MQFEIGLSVTAVFICLSIFQSSGSGSSSSVSLKITPDQTLTKDTIKLSATCQPTNPTEWNYLTYITIFRFAEKSWHQHLVTMAGEERPHLGYDLDSSKYVVNGFPLSDPEKAYAQVDIIKPDESDFIKDDTYLTIGCKIIGIMKAGLKVMDPVTVYKLQYEGELSGTIQQYQPVPLYILILISVIIKQCEY